MGDYELLPHLVSVFKVHMVVYTNVSSMAILAMESKTEMLHVIRS